MLGLCEYLCYQNLIFMITQNLMFVTNRKVENIQALYLKVKRRVPACSRALIAIMISQ